MNTFVIIPQYNYATENLFVRKTVFFDPSAIEHQVVFWHRSPNVSQLRLLLCTA